MNRFEHRYFDRSQKRRSLDAIKKAFKEDVIVLIEEYIKGKELTCAVMGNTGQSALATLPPIEIVPAGEFLTTLQNMIRKKRKKSVRSDHKIPNYKAAGTCPEDTCRYRLRWLKPLRLYPDSSR